MLETARTTTPCRRRSPRRYALGFTQGRLDACTTVIIQDLTLTCGGLSGCYTFRVDQPSVTAPSTPPTPTQNATTSSTSTQARSPSRSPSQSTTYVPTPTRSASASTSYSPPSFPGTVIILGQSIASWVVPPPTYTSVAIMNGENEHLIPVVRFSHVFSSLQVASDPPTALCNCKFATAVIAPMHRRPPSCPSRNPTQWVLQVPAPSGRSCYLTAGANTST